ncbi:MAG: ParB/Srx family N-terminal domain-containing protein, partial [Candidatus Binatia bacterium]
MKVDANDATTIALAQLRLDGGTQSRADLDENVIDDYAGVYAEHGKLALPPVVTFFDGTDYYLADGFHRYRAAERAG